MESKVSRKHEFFRYTATAVAIIITIAVRIYKIDRPLWLDELFGYSLAKLGPEAIIQNSWTDPHPPFYYLMQWIVLSPDHTRSEIVWRWIPLLCGVLVVFNIGIIVKRITDSFTGIIVCLIAATLPSLVLYSQEARPFSSLVLLASLSAWITVTLLRNTFVGKLWMAWIITSLLGLYSGYAYLMVVGVQLAFLGFYFHRRAAWWIASTIVISGLVVLLPFMTNSLGRVATQHANTEPLTFWRTLQTLCAGEPMSYGFSIAHTLFPLAVMGLCIAASIRAIRLCDSRLVYFILQVTLPIGAFFTLSPFFGIRLPPAEAKQFIVLLPVFLVLIASGIAELHHWLGYRNGSLLAITICGVMILLNTTGLQSYWSNPKSIEGLAVLRVNEKLQAGENIVSLHYSLNYALGFYTPDAPIYLNPKKDGNSYKYQLASSEIPNLWREAEDIRASGKFWILAHVNAYREPIASLISGCQIIDQETFSVRNGAFEIMKVECPQ